MLFWLAERATHELALFAAVAFLIGGIDDLAVDSIWLVRSAWRKFVVYQFFTRVDAATLAPPERPGRIAIFIGAWDEARVIGAMLRHALDRFDHDNYRIFIGVYPNDPETRNAIEVVRSGHPKGSLVRIVEGWFAGPTTKAECLNRLWRALLREEAETGVRFKAIVLHDAEDVVHSAELKLFDKLIERFDLVQLPVLPMIVPGSNWVSGHYLDEFAESHGKQLIVREAVGAGMPSAGVGCAIGRDAIQRMADRMGGAPFDAASLTEDYEIGLRLRDQGGRGAFVRLPGAGQRSLVAVRAYFPATFGAAVNQKARWMTGIALSGWDRLGWRGGFTERWMRLRDRRAPLAALVLASAYAAMAMMAGLWIACRMTGRPFPAFSETLASLLMFNGSLFLWRFAMRATMVGRAYGWRQGARAIPRMLVANAIEMAAAVKAVARYLRGRREGRSTWYKTEHSFPDIVPAE